MSSSEAFVQFKNVQKSYDGETLVVKNLNLDIQEGEFLTMLGPFRVRENHLLVDACRIRNGNPWRNHSQR